jgi:hypothetical protein
MFLRSVRCAIVAVLVSALVAVVLPSPASAASNPVDSRFFGVHHSPAGAQGRVGWPQAPVGSLRLWDAGVTWRDLEVRNNVFDWRRLDAAVARARANRSDVLLVLGLTPRFHALRPNAASFYGPGASSMPKYGAWKRYVRAVAARNLTHWYRAVRFQVWNEPNVSGMWQGTPQQMATLTRWTREALDDRDRRAVLVSPALVTRLTSQRTWLDQYFRQRTGHRPVAAYVDVVGLQLYPLKGGPEASMELLGLVRQILRNRAVRKPIYNTEINYGMHTGALAGRNAFNIARSTEEAYVARTYLLNAAARISRVYWYGWTLRGPVNTEMTYRNGVTLTGAGRTFGVMRLWLERTRPKGCTRDRAGTYTCVFTYKYGVRRAVWNPSRTVPYTVGSYATSYRTLDNVKRATHRGATLRVGKQPVLIRSAR